MKAAFAAVAALVVACSMAVPAPKRVAQIPPPERVGATNGELHFSPFAILPGRAPGADAAHPEGTLLLVERTGDAAVVEEMDAASSAIVRTAALGSGELADAARSSSRLYVLFTDAERGEHRLVALDLASLAVVARVTAPRAAPGKLVDHASPARIEPGKRGVRVVFRSTCPSEGEDEDGCVFYETHALGDLSPTVTRHYGMSRLWDATKPALAIPDDQGASDALAVREPAWELDRRARVLRAPDGRTVACPVRGELLIDRAWVGRRLFVRTSGCCGGEHGGFFVCEAPRD